MAKKPMRCKSPPLYTALNSIFAPVSTCRRQDDLLRAFFQISELEIYEYPEVGLSVAIQIVLCQYVGNSPLARRSAEDHWIESKTSSMPE